VVRRSGVVKAQHGDVGPTVLLVTHQRCDTFLWESHRCMRPKIDVWQGTLALMALKTLSVLGPQHGYGIARRVEQTSDNLLSVNHGTLYPVLLKLEQEGAIASEWVSRRTTAKRSSIRSPGRAARC